MILAFANTIASCNIIHRYFLQQRFLLLQWCAHLAKNYGRLIFMSRIHSDCAHTVLSLDDFFLVIAFASYLILFHSFLYEDPEFLISLISFSFPYFGNWPKRGSREPRVWMSEIFYDHPLWWMTSRMWALLHPFLLISSYLDIYTFFDWKKLRYWKMKKHREKKSWPWHYRVFPELSYQRNRHIFSTEKAI